MAILRVNPTRMELSRLKKRLKTAVRGHKLLKDKRDEMVRRFMELIRENKELREQMEEKVYTAQKGFLGASLAMSPEDLDAALMHPARRVELDVSKNNIMSVEVPRISFHEVDTEESFYPYGMLMTTGELDVAVDNLSEALPSMIRLEYVMIPQLEETIKYITMKLDENERGNTTRLMKMKGSWE